MEQISFTKFTRHLYLLILMFPVIIIVMTTTAIQTENEAEFQKWNTLVFNITIAAFCLAVLVINVIKLILIYGKEFEFVYRKKRIRLQSRIGSKNSAYLILILTGTFCAIAVLDTVPRIIEEIYKISAQ